MSFQAYSSLVFDLHGLTVLFVLIVAPLEEIEEDWD